LRASSIIFSVYFRIFLPLKYVSIIAIKNDFNLPIKICDSSSSLILFIIFSASLSFECLHLSFFLEKYSFISYSILIFNDFKNEGYADFLDFSKLSLINSSKPSCGILN
jgi:hypothetical protein